MPRSYRDEWACWGIVTALQNLLMYQKDTYTVTDIVNIARAYGLEDDLLKRMSWVPDNLEELDL